MFVILIVLVLWCFYFHMNRVIQTRRKLIYVEVRSHDSVISRTQSKVNLNLVIESNMKRKNNNMLFDKFWYQTRETRLLQNHWEGLYFDSRHFVTLTQNQTIDLAKINKTVKDDHDLSDRKQPKLVVQDADAELDGGGKDEKAPGDNHGIGFKTLKKGESSDLHALSPPVDLKMGAFSRQGSAQLSRKEIDEILSNRSRGFGGAIKRSSSLSMGKKSAFVNELSKSISSPHKRGREIDKDSYNFSNN